MLHAKKYRVFLVGALVVLLCVCLAVAAEARIASEADIQDTYDMCEITKEALLEELAAGDFPVDPRLCRINVEQIEAIPAQQAVYRAECVKSYGRLFRISFVAVFTDRKGQNCVAAWLAVSPQSLAPALEGISLQVIADAETDCVTLFARYRLTDASSSIWERFIMERMAQATADMEFSATGARYSLVDAILCRIIPGQGKAT